MPFKSKAQQAYLYIHHPEVAKEFQAATPQGVKLPKRVKKEGEKKRAHAGFIKGLL